MTDNIHLNANILASIITYKNSWVQTCDNSIRIVNTGASISAGVIVSINGIKLFGKAYIKYCGKEFNTEINDLITGLEYEEKIYRLIVPNLLELCPNFIKYYTTIQVDYSSLVSKFYDRIKSIIDRKIINVSYLNFKDSPKYPITIFFTKFVDQSLSMDNWIKTEPNDEDISKVIAQIVIAITIMDYHDLQHNDLHIGNIIIHTLDHPTEIVCNLPNKNTTIISNVRYQAIILDWDFSYTKDIGINNKIARKFYANIGIKNQTDFEFDLFTFLATVFVVVLTTKKVYTSLLIFIHSIWPNIRTIIKITAQTGYMCRLNAPAREITYASTAEELFAKIVYHKYFYNNLKISYI